MPLGEGLIQAPTWSLLLLLKGSLMASRLDATCPALRLSLCSGRLRWGCSRHQVMGELQVLHSVFADGVELGPQFPPWSLVRAGWLLATVFCLAKVTLSWSFVFRALMFRGACFSSTWSRVYEAQRIPREDVTVVFLRSQSH